MQEGSYPPGESRTKPKQSMKKRSMIPLTSIIIAFVLMFFGIVLEVAAEQKDAPDSEDFSVEGYQEAIEDYNDAIANLEATSSLFLYTGTILLGAGLFFYAAETSSHLPDYARAALMFGAMYYLVRMGTSDLSIIDMLTLFGTNL